MADELPDYLPELAREIAEVIGLDGMYRLVDAYGGTEIRVPGRNNGLRDVLTSEQYQAFVHMYRNEKLLIPKLEARLHQLRREESRRLAAQGQTRAAIARHHGVSERTVYNHLADGNDDQLDLFTND